MGSQIHSELRRASNPLVGTKHIDLGLHHTKTQWSCLLLGVQVYLDLPLTDPGSDSCVHITTYLNRGVGVSSTLGTSEGSGAERDGQ